MHLLLTNMDEQINIYDYLIKKPTSLLLKDCLNSLNKDFLKQYLEDNFLDDVNELVEEVLGSIDNLLSLSFDDPFTVIYFKTILADENTTNVSIYPSDIQSFMGFLYNKDGELSFFIPKDVKKVIKKYIK